MLPQTVHALFAPRPHATGRSKIHSMKKILLPALAFLALAFAATAAVLPPEQLLPDDTLFAIAIPDFTKVQSIYKSYPQLQLWADPAMKPFRDKFTGKLQSEFIAPLERELNIHFADYTTLPQGQMTLAVVQDGWQGDSGDPALLFLLDARDKSSQLKTNLADLKKKWVASGRTAKTETIRNVDFSVITLSSNDIPHTLKKAAGGHGDSGGDSDSGAKSADSTAKVAPGAVIYIGQSDSLLIMGTSPKVIEKVLAAMAGADVRTLSQLPAFSANYDALFRDAPMYGWINAHALVEVGRHAAMNAAANSQSDSSPSPTKIFTALGLDGLKTIAFSYHFAPEGAQASFLVGVPEDNRTGLFKMFAGEPKDFRPPAFVPADTVIFRRWRIDGKKLWDDLRQIVSDISPQALGGVDFMLNSAEAKAKEKDPDFDIQKNLFGNLGDDFIAYQKAARGDSMTALASPPTLYLLGSPHPEQLANALNSLLVLLGQQSTPTSRDFLGRKIYSLPLPSPGMAAQTNSLNYVSSGGYLAMTTDTAMLEEYLRSGDSPAKPLRETPGLDAAIEKVSGPGISLFGYSNDSETVRQLLNALKNDSSNNGMGTLAPLAMMMGMGNANFKDWVDFSLLPDFSQVSKYFSFSVYAGAATPDGLILKAFTPTPAQFHN
jgi:hypothetical protein